MRQAKLTFTLRPRHILLCCLAGMTVLLCMVVSQSEKLKQIASEQQQLTAAYDELQLEEQRLSRMLEYSQTDEYLQQYAREKLGYVGPNDYKFYRDTPEQ